MKDKELRRILWESGIIGIDKKGDTIRYFGSHAQSRKPNPPSICIIREKIHDQERQIQDQQEQIDFILKHLNIDIEKFEGYVKKELDK